MSKIWQTRWGKRRVKHEPPDLDEALMAAEAMTQDINAKAEIAAQLMGLPVRDVLQHIRAHAPSAENVEPRTLVVEYRRSRRGAPV